jgi:ATP-dependent Clp protease protease subunit
MRMTINQILSKHSGQPVEKIEKDDRTRLHHESRSGKEYGMIDEIIFKHR